ncbi:hypothetical protein PSENEW3_00003558 [Picochlorum sp. SENEW3]|nr:hypothetical protein PSENEW3_00003558 [Picochlorum sp. SENEW3]
MTDTESIENLLEHAYPSPAHWSSTDVADVLVLSLHCMMVEQGFVAQGNGGQAAKQDETERRRLLDMNQKPIYTPPKRWNALEDEWIVLYVREGCPHWFRLHCALQRSTGRLFIHACETDEQGAPKPSNIQVLGLQLSNYTCEGDKASVSEDSWKGYIHNERTLREMFREFVMDPLWKNAEVGHMTNADENMVHRNDADASTDTSTSLYDRLPSVNPAVGGLILGCVLVGIGSYMFASRASQRLQHRST